MAGKHAVSLGARRPLIVTDRNVVAAGLVEPIIGSLSAEGIGTDVFDGVIPNPDADVVEQCATVIREGGYDLAIGVGGGSCLDVCKAAAALAKNEGRIEDYFGNDKIPSPGVAKMLVPTTSGTGSEITPSAVISDAGAGTKNSVKSIHLLADVVLLDPELTVTMPPHLTADVGMDALSHAIEAFVSVYANPLSDTLAARAIRLIARNLPTAFANPRDREARYHMCIAATMAGMAFTYSGLGAVHALGYPLCTDYGLTHGRSNAVLLPHVMSVNATACLAKFSEIASLMGVTREGVPLRDVVEAGINAIRQLLAEVEIDGRLRNYGIPREAIPSLAEKALLSGTRLLPSNPRVLTKADAIRIYEMAW